MSMPIPDDWDGTTWDCWMIEWPSSTLWTAILCGFVTQPTRGRFWDASTGSVAGAQAIGKQIENRNETEDWCMTCLSELSEAITGLGASIRSGGGCVTPGQTGTVGSGGTQETPSDFIDNGSTTFPAGYPDRTEYEDYKCGLAETARARWENDVKNAKILNLAGLTLSSVLFELGVVGAAAFATPIPFDDLVVLALAMIVIWGLLASLAAALQEAENYISLFDICLWYGASDAEQAISETHDDIDAQTFTVADIQVKTILKAFITSNVINPLFEEKPVGADYSGIGDCSSCLPCLPIEANELTDGGAAVITEIVPGVTYEVEAHFNTINTRYEAIFSFNVQSDNPTPVFCGPMKEISHSIIAGSITPDPPPNAWRIFNQTGGSLWNSNVAPAQDFCSARWVIVSDTAFTFQIDIGDDC